MERLYRVVVAFLFIVQLVWFFGPWGLAYDQESIAALVWLGYGAILSEQTIGFISYVVVFLYSLAYIGLFYFYRPARTIYLLLIIVNGLFMPAYGLLVQSGFENMLIYFITIGDGFIIAMAYFTNISKRFANAQ